MVYGFLIFGFLIGILFLCDKKHDKYLSEKWVPFILDERRKEADRIEAFGDNFKS